MDIIATKRRNPQPGIGSIRAALIVSLGLALAGCETVPPSPSANTAPPARDNRGTQKLSAVPMQSEAPTMAPHAAQQPAVRQPTSSQTPRVESKLAVGSSSKGAEKLPAPHPPVAAATSERPGGKPRPVEPPTRAMQVSNTGTSAPVAELIVKGPPHPEEPKTGAKKAAIWAGLGITGAVLAVLVSLYVVRRPEPAEVSQGKKLDPMRADGMLTKEPLEQP